MIWAVVFAVFAIFIVVGIKLLEAQKEQEAQEAPSNVLKLKETPRAKKEPVTENEQKMYWRLVEAFPENPVGVQVSFNALLWAKTQAVRATFNRKMADFVLFSKDFKVIAVIELDDSSHDGREDEDGKRDDLFNGAGITNLRLKRVPDVLEIRQMVARLTELKTPKNPAR